MAPWMVIAGLLVTGFAVLLVAPTWHRRINAQSRQSAEDTRIQRAVELRDSSDGASRAFADAAQAIALRDRLLLRGVRSEVLAEGDGAALVYRTSDEQTVAAAIEELGPEPS